MLFVYNFSWQIVSCGEIIPQQFLQSMSGKHSLFKAQDEEKTPLIAAKQSAGYHMAELCAIGGHSL